MVLNITKIPTVNTSLNFQSTSQSQNNYGGYGSQQAQNQALNAAIQASRAANPDEFIDPNTGKEYGYVSKTIQRTQSQTPKPLTLAQKTPQIKITPQQFNIQRSQQGPVKPIKSIPTLQGSVDISQSKIRASSTPRPVPQPPQQSYNQWSGNVGGQIQDEVFGAISEAGKGQRNIGEDYLNISNLDYEDKSLINQSIGKSFEGDFKGAGKTITSNPAQLAGELSIEVPLTLLPIGPLLKGAKIAVAAGKKAIKQLIINPSILAGATKAEKKVIEKVADKLLLNNKIPTKTELTKVNTIAKKYTDTDIKRAEDLIGKSPGTKTDITKTQNFVRNLDGSIEKEIKNQIKPTYTKKYVPGGVKKSTPLTIKQQEAKAIKDLQIIANNPTSSKTQKLNALKVLEKFAKAGVVKRGSNPTNKFIGPKRSTNNIQKTYFDNKITSFTPVGIFSPAAISGGATAIESAQKPNNIFNKLLPSVPEAEGFPGVGPAVKGTAKVVKGGMSEFEKMYRQLPHNKQMDIFKNAFFSPETQKIAEKINTKSTGLRTNTVKNNLLKTTAKIKKVRNQAIRTQWLKNAQEVGYRRASVLTEKQLGKKLGVTRTTINSVVKDIRPGKGKVGEIQKRANSIFARDKTHTSELSLGAIGVGAVGLFEGFGQIPEAHATVNTHKNKSTPWVTTNLNTPKKSSVGGGIDYMVQNFSNIKSTNIYTKSTPKSRNLLAEQNAKTAQLDYNPITGAPKIDEAKSKTSSKMNQTIPNIPPPQPINNGLTVTVTRGDYIPKPIYDKFGQRDFLAEQQAATNANAVRSGTKSTQHQTSKIKLTSSQKLEQARKQQLSRAKQETSRNQVISRKDFNANPKLNTSYNQVKKTNYGNGIIKTSTIYNPYADLGNFSNPFFGKVKPYGKQSSK